MPSVRRTPLVTDQYYHIFNRGVARNPTFLAKYDYEQALLTLSYYRFAHPPMRLSRLKEQSRDQREILLKNLSQTEKYVEIVSFVLMPNHFHFLIKQVKDNGISLFVSQFTNSYTRYFNTKYDRVGPVFQGIFKSVHIETDLQLLHVSRYIHLNPITSFVVNETHLLSYPWSSLGDFLTGESRLVELRAILNHFPSPSAYKKFVLDQIAYAQELERIRHLTLEN